MNEIEIFLERESGEKTITLESEGALILPNLEDLEVTPTKEQQVFNHKNSDGYDNVKVNAIPDEYIIPEGMLPITENTTYDVRRYARVSASVHPVPNLQDKSITITENGTQNISADGGYDGLGNVEVTTNVEATGIPKMNGINGLVETINAVFSKYTETELNAPNNYQKYYDTPVTLYSPADGYNGYIIRKRGENLYGIIWFNDNTSQFRLDASFGSIQMRYIKLAISNDNIIRGQVNYVWSSNSTLVKNTGYYSENYTSIEECLTAIQSPSTAYSTATNSDWSNVADGEFDVSFTNIPMQKDNHFINSRRISSNETIEYIS